MCLEGWKPWGDPQVGHSQRDLSFATGRKMPLKTIDHVAVAQHAILNALGHISTDFSGLDGPQRPLRRQSSPALRH